jgi:hypothetical protein
MTNLCCLKKCYVEWANVGCVLPGEMVRLLAILSEEGVESSPAKRIFFILLLHYLPYARRNTLLKAMRLTKCMYIKMCVFDFFIYSLHILGRLAEKNCEINSLTYLVGR